MLKLFVIFLALFFPLAGCYSSQKQERVAQAVPNNAYTWDFGQAKEGVVLTHTFVFKNELSQPLNIKDVSSSCGCTVSEIKKKSLEPQEETTLEVKFNSKGYSGPVEQNVYVNTDNLDNPIVKYIIKATVIK